MAGPPFRFAAIETLLSWSARNSASSDPRTAVCAAVSLCGRFLNLNRALGPVALKIGVNSVCNCVCATCDLGTGADTPFSRNMTVGHGELDLTTAARAIDSVARFRPRVLIDSAEPLLYAPLFDLVRHVRERRLSCMVQTNGLLLADRAREVAVSGLTHLGVSLDGPAAVHDRIRGVAGAFGRAMAGIEAVSRCASAPSRRPRVIVNTVISALSQRTLVPFLRELAQVRQPIARVCLYHQNFISPSMAAAHAARCGDRLPVAASNLPREGRGADALTVDCAALADAIAEIRSLRLPFPLLFIPDLSGERDCSVYYREHHHFFGTRTCLLPWLAARIRPDGSVGIIARCFDISLGSIADTSLARIFNGPRFRAFRRELRRAGTYPACARCCGIL